MHLTNDLPSIEGVLKRRWPEYVLLVPKYLVAAGGIPQEPDCKDLCVPRDKVAFYERL